MKSTTEKKRPIWKSPSSVVGIAVLTGVAFLGGFIAREIRAKIEVDRRIEEFRVRGVPTDNASLELHFVSNTSSALTQEWSEAVQTLGNWGTFLGNDLLSIRESSDATPEAALRGEEWPQEKLVVEFLERIQPLVQRLHKLADRTSEPVWQPIQFDGMNTLLGPLQESRLLLHVLSLDYDYALFSKDRERAMRDLKSMRACRIAYDWPFFAVTHLISLNNRNSFHDAICRGMQSSIWTEQDLTEMQELIGGPIDILKVWQSILATDRAATLATLNSNSSALISKNDPELVDFSLWLPSLKLQYLTDVEQSQALAKDSLDNLALRQTWDGRHEDQGLIAGRFLSGRPQVLRALILHEESRKITSAAVLTKQFKVHNQNLPSSLGELRKSTPSEISSDVLKGFDSSPLGFQTDGERVYLWNVRPTNEFGPYYPELPDFDPDTGIVNRMYGRVVVVR